MFWLGWGKKIKEIFTKKEADKLYVKLSGDETINGNKTLNGTTTLGRVTNLGSNSNGDAFFLPKKDSGKSILYTGNSAFNDDKRFDIDLQNRSKLLNVPNPTSDKDAANKFYVDNKIKYTKNTLPSASPNLTFTILNDVQRKKILSINIYRQNTNNQWVISDTISLQYKAFIEDNKIKFTNLGTPQNYTINFMYEIYYLEN